MNKAEQLIACLEGEIAKRDEELAACRVAVENCDLFRARIAELEEKSSAADDADFNLRGLLKRGAFALGLDPENTSWFEVIGGLEQLRAELAAIKAQEPVQVDYVAVMRADGDGGLEVGWLLEGGTAELMNGMYLCCVGGGTLLFEEGSGHLYAAPVPEAKAQGVVMPEPLMAAITRADDVLHALSNWESSSVKLEQRHGPEWTKEVDAIRSELHTQLARLNAAPVQQVSVPDGWKLVRNSGSIILKCEGQWSAGFSQYDSSTLSRNLWRLFDAMLAAAQAAPAADASDVLEQAMYTLISIGYHENSGLVHELRQALATNRAKGVV